MSLVLNAFTSLHKSATLSAEPAITKTRGEPGCFGAFARVEGKPGIPKLESALFYSL